MRRGPPPKPAPVRFEAKFGPELKSRFDSFFERNGWTKAENGRKVEILLGFAESQQEVREREPGDKSGISASVTERRSVAVQVDDHSGQTRKRQRQPSPDFASFHIDPTVLQHHLHVVHETAPSTSAQTMARLKKQRYEESWDEEDYASDDEGEVRKPFAMKSQLGVDVMHAPPLLPLRK